MAVSLPLIPSVPNYQFGTQLGDTQYLFNIRWNTRDEAWYMDILAEDEDPIASGIKIVLGAILGFTCADSRMPKGMLMAADLSNSYTDATLDDLGVRVLVYFYSADELNG